MTTYKMDSSAIDEITYDTETKLLRVTFKSGGTYEYYEVPKKLITNWLKAESAGRYFHKYIKQYSINNY